MMVRKSQINKVIKIQYEQTFFCGKLEEYLVEEHENIDDIEEEELKYQDNNIIDVTTNPPATREFIEKWRQEKRFSWLEYDEKPEFAKCNLCCGLFKCTSRADVLKHIVVPKHNSAFKKHVLMGPAKSKIELLLEDEDLKPWFTVDHQGRPFCSCCQAFLRGGKKDLLRHSKTEKHMKYLVCPNRK